MKSRSILGPDGRPIETRRAQRVRQFLNSGYSHSAASLTKPVFKGWEWAGGSPDDDIVENLPIIRQRSRQLTMDAPVIAGLYRTLTTNCVGEGLKPEPSPDAELLGMDPEDALKWKASVMRYWEMFAESTSCDVYRRDNFYELTRLVNRAQDESGDVFVTLPVFERRGVPFDLRLQVVEADCCCDPEGAGFLEYQQLGSDVFGGVEQSPYGNVLAYWFHTGHPLSIRSRTHLNPDHWTKPQWVRVPAYGEETGRVNVLHLMESIRPGQRRGLPIITPVVELALTLDRYMKAEAVAAQIQAMFTLVITSENPDGTAGEMNSLIGDDDDDLDDDSLIRLGNGIVQYARAGEKIEPVNPSRPTSAFEPFVASIQKMMGAAVGVPYELLVQSFNSSYSASRAAMNVASANFKVRRAGLVHDFCQPVYEAFMDEAVARGWIYAPGYWEDPIKRKAYTRAKWHGPGMPQIDLKKEIEAGKLRADLGVSTWSEVTSELTGGNWYNNAAERGREIETAKKMGLIIDQPLSENKEGDNDEEQE